MKYSCTEAPYKPLLLLFHTDEPDIKKLYLSLTTVESCSFQSTNTTHLFFCAMHTFLRPFSCFSVWLSTLVVLKVALIYLVLLQQ